MSAPNPVEEPVATPARGRSLAFNKRRRSPPMPAEQSRRQSNVIESAWRHFRGAEPAIAFLNTRHDALGALPLHLAIESDEGLERVESLLRRMSPQA